MRVKVTDTETTITFSNHGEEASEACMLLSTMMNMAYYKDSVEQLHNIVNKVVAIANAPIH